MAKKVRTLHVRHEVLQKFQSEEKIPAYDVQVCFSDGTSTSGWVREEAFSIDNLSKIVDMLSRLDTK